MFTHIGFLGEIYVVNADGSGLTNVTNHPSEDVDASWSPDGQRIAFSSFRDGNGEIYVMGVDGSGLTRLTNDPVFRDYDASWSPDGRLIAFTKSGDGRGELWVMAADGSAPRMLATGGSPTWSPDGRRIAFASSRDGDPAIYVMNADGSSQVRLSNHPANDIGPSWGPNGLIAFTSWRDLDSAGVQIYVMAEDGSQQRQITSDIHRRTNSEPSWGPWLNATPSDTMPPPMPGHPVQVTLVGTDSTRATYNVSWMASVDEPSGQPVGLYRLAYGFNDDSWTGTDSATNTSAQIRFPLHGSGQAAAGWVCVRAEDTAGNQSWDQACNGLTVPARDTIPPPMPGHPVQVTLVGADASGATYDVSWMASVDEPSGQPVGLYRLAYGFNDGSWTGTDSATSTSTQIRFPLHGSGQAATGWVCVQAEDAAGNQSVDHACTGLTVPGATTNDLGTLGGASSHALDVNRNEQIVGQSRTAAGETHAFIYADGVMQDLGTLGGTFSTADDINDAGQVAGRSTTAAGEMRAVLWTDGAAVDLGPITSTIGRVWLNENGQAAWSAPVPGGGTQAARWSGGVMQELGSLGGTFVSVAGINDQGAVIGRSTTVPGSSFAWAFVWRDGLMTGLGSSITSASAINASGQIAGTSSDDQGDRHAVLWEDGNATDLGTLPGDVGTSAILINDLGWVAGESFSFPRVETPAPFLWRAGTMLALDPEYETNVGTQRVAGMNLWGLVVGHEVAVNGIAHARAWNNGLEWELGTLGGAGSQAVAVNVNGTVVGWAQTASGAVHAVAWHLPPALATR